MKHGLNTDVFTAEAQRRGGSRRWCVGQNFGCDFEKRFRGQTLNVFIFVSKSRVQHGDCGLGIGSKLSERLHSGRLSAGVGFCSKADQRRNTCRGLQLQPAKHLGGAAANQRLRGIEVMDKDRYGRQSIRSVTGNPDHGRVTVSSQRICVLDRSEKRRDNFRSHSVRGAGRLDGSLLVGRIIRKAEQLGQSRRGICAENLERNRSPADSHPSGVFTNPVVAKLWNDKFRQFMHPGGQFLAGLGPRGLRTDPFQQMRQRVCTHVTNGSSSFKIFWRLRISPQRIVKRVHPLAQFSPLVGGFAVSCEQESQREDGHHAAQDERPLLPLLHDGDRMEVSRG